MSTRLAMGADAFAASFTEGTTMSMEEAVSYAPGGVLPEGIAILSFWQSNSHYRRVKLVSHLASEEIYRFAKRIISGIQQGNPDLGWELADRSRHLHC